MARFLISFTGLTGHGTISVSELKAGDQVLAVTNSNGGNNFSNFAPFVIADGELIQANSDFSSFTMYALIERTLII